MPWAIIALAVSGIIFGSFIVGRIIIQMPAMKDLGMLLLHSIIVGIGVILAGVKLRAK